MHWPIPYHRQNDVSRYLFYNTDFYISIKLNKHDVGYFLIKLKDKG